MTHHQPIRICLVVLGISALLGCSCSSSGNTQLSATISNTTKSVQIASISKVSNEPSSKEIPLSCRMEYVKSIDAESIKPEDELYSERQNQKALETVKITDAYVESGLYEEGLKLFEPGSPAWIRIAQAYIANSKSEAVIQLLKSAVSKTSSDSQRDILAKLYLADGEPKLALEQVQSMQAKDNFSKAELLVRIAALFAKTQQAMESEEALAEAVVIVDTLLPESISSEYKASLLSLSVESFAEANQFKKALQFVDELRSIKSFRRKEEIIGRALVNIANRYIQHGQNNQALKILSKVEQRNYELLKQERKQNFPPTLPSHIIFSSALAGDTISAYANAGEFQKALELIDTYSEGYKPWHVVQRLTVAEHAWRANKKVQAQKILAQARKMVESTEMKADAYILLDLAEAEQKFGQENQSKALVNDAFALAKAKPFFSSSEISSRTKTLNLVLKSYIALRDYAQALVVAQAETDIRERDRLIKLVQCAAYQGN
jgi:tetratricopeptide (TPR) repeat protein